jgi:hypothetical protein
MIANLEWAFLILAATLEWPGLGLVTPLALGSCAWLHTAQHCTQRARRSPIRCTSSAGPPQTEQCAITGRKRTHRLAVSLGSDSLPSDTGALVITWFVAVRRIPAVTRGGPERFSGFLLLPPPYMSAARHYAHAIAAILLFAHSIY